jgi:phosphoribosylamine-glycine ligase
VYRGADGVVRGLPQVFDDAEKALKYIDDTPHTLVVKASGLAAGKGVIVPKNKDEAKQAVREIMVPHPACRIGTCNTLTTR